MRSLTIRIISFLTITCLLISGCALADEDMVAFDAHYTSILFRNKTISEIYDDPDLRAQFVICLLLDYSEMDPDIESDFSSYILESAFIVGKSNIGLSMGVYRGTNGVFLVYYPVMNPEKANYLEISGTKKDVSSKLTLYTSKNNDEFCEVTNIELINAVESIAGKK